MITAATFIYNFHTLKEFSRCDYLWRIAVFNSQFKLPQALREGPIGEVQQEVYIISNPRRGIDNEILGVTTRVPADLSVTG